MISHRYYYEGDKVSSIIDDIKRDITNQETDISIESTTMNGVTILNIVNERFFFRTSSYASVVMTFVIGDNKIEVLVTSSGAGNGIFNFSWGATTKLYEVWDKFLVKHKFKK